VRSLGAFLDAHFPQLASSSSDLSEDVDVGFAVVEAAAADEAPDFDGDETEKSQAGDARHDGRADERRLNLEGGVVVELHVLRFGDESRAVVVSSPVLRTIAGTTSSGTNRRIEMK